MLLKKPIFNIKNALGNKLCKLKGIIENKDILFGCFSDRLTKKDKISCWKGVHEKRASLLGLIATDKDSKKLL